MKNQVFQNSRCNTGCSGNDYYPFGMVMTGRSFTTEAYRYGFNGQEKDDEIYGEGNSYTAEYWQYDSRLVRRWNLDPVRVAWESPYAAFRGNPILLADPNGDCPDGCPEEEDNVVLKTIDKAAGSVMEGYKAVSDWWDGLDFSMSIEGNIKAGPAATSEVKAMGSRVGLGKGTSYKIIGGSLTIQQGAPESNDLNGTRGKWEGYYIGGEGQYKVKEYQSGGASVGGESNITYDKDVSTGIKSNIAKTNTFNGSIIKVETSQNLAEYPRGGLMGSMEQASPITPTGKSNQFIGVEFGIDQMAGFGFDLSFKMGFTNNYVEDNTPF